MTAPRGLTRIAPGMCAMTRAEFRALCDRGPGY